MSMVMPEAGLFAVVAMALAATEAKKKAKSKREREAHGRGRSRRPEGAQKKMATAMALTMMPSRIVVWRCRDRCARIVSAARERKARSAMPKEPAMTRSDLMTPKMPAVAMAPTPIKRT